MVLLVHMPRAFNIRFAEQISVFPSDDMTGTAGRGGSPILLSADSAMCTTHYDWPRHCVN